MNPLTQIKNTQKASKWEISQGFSDAASWHARYKHSAYVFAGGLPYDLTEGDLLAVFSQYGELVDINVVKHKDTGKPRGFAFLAYEDQRSTTLAVDNLSGAKVAGRIIRVEHVDNYKRKKAEMEGREPSPDTEEEEEEEAPEAEPPAQNAPSSAAATNGQGAANSAGAAGQDAWMASNSIFNMLRDADPLPPPLRAAAAVDALRPGKQHKQKKEKKQKEKKEKHAKKDKKEKHGRGEVRSSPEAEAAAAPANAKQSAATARPSDRRDVGPAAVETAAGRRRDPQGRDARDDRHREHSHGGNSQRRDEDAHRGKDGKSRERSRSHDRQRRDDREVGGRLAGGGGGSRGRDHSPQRRHDPRHRSPSQERRDHRRR